MITMIIMRKQPCFFAAVDTRFAISSINYNKWQNIIEAVTGGVLRRVRIESTRQTMAVYTRAV